MGLAGLDVDNVKIIIKLKKDDFKCDFKTLQQLLKIITKVSKNVSEPSKTICLLSSYLHLAFESMYGLDEDVFRQCRVKKKVLKNLAIKK